MDYFETRYFSSPQGRFVSPDTLPVTTENFLNPQRWCLYTYVNNNPLGAVDRSGGQGQGKTGDKVITVFLHISADESRDKIVDPDTKKVLGNVPGTWPQTKAEAERNSYRVVLFGSSEMTGRSGLPDVNTFARNYNFESGLTNSEVMIYIGHGAGTGEGTYEKPFQQEGLFIDSAYYKADGNHLVIEGSQSGYVLPKPEVTARVMVNFSCDASRQGAKYFNFTGQGQLMVTLNSGMNGITNASSIEKAANIFVRVYASTRGNYDERARAAAAAAQKFLVDSARTIQKNRGDGIEVQKVN